MSWRANLLPATFRGVAFFVALHDAELGRRVQVHEFPQRDLPYAEDLGRAVRKFTVDAFVLGANYFSARNRLLAAVEKPGSGQLDHPYLGELRVSVLSCRLHEETAEGGVARFSIEFVETGDARFPTAAVDTPAVVAAAADHAAAAVAANFARRHTVAGRPAFVADASKGIFGSALGSIAGAVAKVRGVAAQVAKLQRDVDAARRNLTTLIYAPASAAQALLASVRQLVRSVASTPRDALSLARTLYRFGSLLPSVAPTTTSRRTQAGNQAQLLELVRVVAVAEGARAASLVDWESFQEAVTARDELVATLDDAMLAATVADDVYDALRALRAAVVRDVAARGGDLARLVAYTPPATAPVLVLAQRLYADATRADELAARNALRHPLFVRGAQPIEVLADA